MVVAVVEWAVAGQGMLPRSGAFVGVQEAESIARVPGHGEAPEEVENIEGRVQERLESIRS